MQPMCIKVPVLALVSRQKADQEPDLNWPLMRRQMVHKTHLVVILCITVPHPIRDLLPQVSLPSNKDLSGKA